MLGETLGFLPGEYFGDFRTQTANATTNSFPFLFPNRLLGEGCAMNVCSTEDAELIVSEIERRVQLISFRKDIKIWLVLQTANSI